MSQNLLTTAAVGALFFLSSFAQAEVVNDLGIEGRYVGELLFESMDVTSEGKIHLGDIETFRSSAFAGMDYDGNAKVTYDEFSVWGPSFAQVAEDAGRKEAYTTASKIIFAFWDRDGDGQMTEREMRVAMASDFRRANLDDDAFLTKDEFIGGFPIMVAMRAAIRPDL